MYAPDREDVLAHLPHVLEGTPPKGLSPVLLKNHGFKVSFDSSYPMY